MKYLVLLAIFSCCIPSFFSQTESSFLIHYDTDYEAQVLQDKNTTHLERLMALGPKASLERTAAAKKEFDAFISEIKSSKLLNKPEAKLMKELHALVHKRFLTRYQFVVPFHEIFKNGTYNCVTASALFALVLEELDIPYNIQEQPTHVYIMAYPDTKAISVEMTAVKDAYYLTARKDVSNAVNALLELQLTDREEIQMKGEVYVYNAFYNTNDVVDLGELTGIQYMNESISAVNDQRFADALSAICKAEMMYDVKKTQLLKTEILLSLMAEAKFESLNEIGYLVGYSNLKKSNKKKVYQQYAAFLNDQLLNKAKRGIVDSSYMFIRNNMTDTAQVKELGSLYYVALSEYYAKAMNTKKQLEFAELAYSNAPHNVALQSWLVQSVMRCYADKLEGEELVEKLENYSTKYPGLLSNNLFLSAHFYAYSDASQEYLDEDDWENGKKYFDLALKTRSSMVDPEIIDPDQIGWLYAEMGAYLYREKKYKESLAVLEEGLKLVPDHERIISRMEIVKPKVK